MVPVVEVVHVEVADRAVTVEVCVDQVRADEKIGVGEDGGRQPVREDSAILAQDDHAVGDDRHDIQLMGGDHEGATRRREAPYQVNQQPLGTWVQRSGWFVEKEHVRSEREYGGNRRPLLFAARKLEWRSIGKVRDFHRGKGLGASAAHIVGSQAELQRAEGHVVEHRGREELDIGVLENEPDFTVEAERVLTAGDGSDVSSQGANGPLTGRHDSVEKLEERRLATPIGTEQGDPLAAPDIEVDAVECHLAARVEVPDASQREEGLARPDGPVALGAGRLDCHGSTRPARTAATATMATMASPLRSMARMR